MSDTEVTAIERHAAALARDLAYWKNLLTTRTNTLQARAEKAEAERDEMQADLRELLKATKPMHTVTEDGTVMRVEQFNDRGDLLYVSRQTHRPTYLGSDPTRAKHYHEAVYRLVPIEAES